MLLLCHQQSGGGWTSHNEIQQKKIINEKSSPAPSEESHPMIDPLGETIEETSEELITTYSKYNNKHMVIF